MSDQYDDNDSRSGLTKESILDALKEKGIADLDALAERAATSSSSGGAGSIAAGFFIHPGYVIEA